MEVRAVAKNISASPRKVKLIVDAVRGKPVQEALVSLQFIPSPAAGEVAKAVKAAAANAENNFHMDPDGLHIVSISADAGIKLKRMMPMSRGRAGRVMKRHCHVTVVVDERER